MIRLTAVLEPVVRALSSDDDVLVRRAAANAIVIALRPYNVDNAATVATIAGPNLQFVRPPLQPHSLFCYLSLMFTYLSELARAVARSKRPRLFGAFVCLFRAFIVVLFCVFARYCGNRVGSTAHGATQLREMAAAAWIELEHLRAWSKSGLGEGGLIQVLP